MLSYQELKTLTKKELLKELETARQNMVKVRIEVKTKHNKDTSSVKKHKKYIAVISTALKELNIEEMVEKSKTIEESK